MKRLFISRAGGPQEVDGIGLLAANPRSGIDFYDESVRSESDLLAKQQAG